MIAPSKTFRRLSILAVGLVYLLMIMGAVVRTTDSGLGCPDWPTCYGQLVPPPDAHAIIEYTHRAVALGASLAALAVTVLAFKDHRREIRFAAPTSLMATLLALQIPLGGVVVVSELTPIMVALHLGVALLILGCLVTLAMAAHAPAEQDFRLQIANLRWLLPVTLAALFALLLTGALVVGSDSTFACLGWPLCSGRLLPGPNDSPLITIQLAHRYMVAAVSILVVTLVVLILHRGPEPLRGWAIVLGGLFTAQVMVGAAQVWLAFPAALRTLHLATGTATWGTLVALAARYWLLEKN